MEIQRTDLAHEAISNAKNNDTRFIKRAIVDGFNITYIDIKDDASMKSQIPVGKYISLFCDKVWIYDDEYKKSVTSVFSQQLKKFILPHYKRVLICCIGNSEITADSLGPRVGARIFVNRHLLSNITAFNLVSQREISMISPGVIGQCGIGIEELAKCVSKLVNADLILTIDALASKKPENLGTTIQISNAGIRPGSGVGGNRQEISQLSTGLPVISIGVPTAIEYSSLVNLQRAERLLVSPKEIDLIISSYSSIIAGGINSALKNF